MRSNSLIILSLVLVSNLVSAQTLILNELCVLPTEVIETSGLEVGPDGCFWTHNDSGNPAKVYCVDTTGTIVRTVDIIGETNSDWEDLAKDPDGNLYIGDFGNNVMARTDLHILIVPSIDTNTVGTTVSGTIAFSFPDQTEFPPSGDYGNFDMESFLWYNDSLHLFSKDRSSSYTGYTKRYRLPAVAGTYVAELVDSFHTGGSSYFNSVTSADISEDNSQMVLLNSDRIWLFENFVGSDFFGGDVAELALGTFTQKEAICFRNGIIYLTDELAFGIGGKLYNLHPTVFVGIDKANELQMSPVYGKDLRLQSVEFEDIHPPYRWRLLANDGRVIREGLVNGNRLMRSELPKKQGVFVLQIFGDDGSAQALLVRL